MKEILENNFEQVYKEYKEYESYLKSAEEKIKTEREQLPKLLQDNENSQHIIIDKLFELQSLPLIQRQDLLNLNTRLIYTYNAVKDVIEIPEEVKREIEQFMPPKQHYKIESGEAKEIDPQYSKDIKEKAREYYQLEVDKYFKNQQPQ